MIFAGGKQPIINGLDIHLSLFLYFEMKGCLLPVLAAINIPSSSSCNLLLFKALLNRLAKVD